MKNLFVPKDKLRSMRKSRNINQHEMGELIGMDQAQYSRRERGEIPIIDHEWSRIAKVLEVSKDEIYQEDSRLINIVNNTENKGHSVNGFQITVKNENAVLYDISGKLDKLINLLANQ